MSGVLRGARGIPVLLLGALALPAGVAAQAEGDGSEAGSTGSADDAGAPVNEAARLLFADGRRAFVQGDYETALERFEQANALSEHPALVYNIASTLDRLRRDAEAADAFERYLELMPDASNRDAVESRIRVLRNQASASAAADDERPEDDDEPSPAPAAVAVDDASTMTDDGSSRGLPPAVFWTGVGLTAVALGVTIWAGLDTVDKDDAYEQAAAEGRPVDEVEQLFDDAESRQRLTNAMIGVTAVLGAATLVTAFFTDFSGGDDSDAGVAGTGPRLEPVVGGSPEGGYVGLRGAF